jgi:hypothetical protein
MSDLIERLEALGAVDAPGDWLDVVARSERDRRRTLRRRLIVAIAVAVLAVPTIAIATHYWDVVSLTATDEEVPVPEGGSRLGYVIDDRLQLPGRPPARLAAPLHAPFLHPEAQLVVPSPDRSQVVYQSWDGTLPLHLRGPQRGAHVLRLFDVETRHDTLVARGAHSPAWRADGVLAYVLRLVPEWPRPRSDARPDGHIVVRRSPQHRPVRWSRSAGEWSRLTWAGRRLIAQVVKRDAFYPEYSLHAFSGPGRSRKLPLGGLIAVSPDGRLVLGRASKHGQLGGSEIVMRVVEVATGRIVDEIVQAGGPGAWSGDTILLTSGLVREPLPPGPGGARFLPGPDYVKMLVLRYAGGKLELERELRLSRDVIEATGLRAANFEFGFDAPAFVDKDARYFTTELVIHNTVRNRQIETRLVYLTCDRIELRCRRGRSLDPYRIRWSALVHNPSRPLRD